MAQRTPISAPPATPPRYSLLIAAAAAGLSEDALYHGWTFDPEVCGSSRGGIAEIDCLGSVSDDSEPMAHPGNPELAIGDPFLVWASDECSTLGSAGRDWVGRATRMLNAVESYWLAREFSTGAFGLAQTALNDAGAATPLGTTAAQATVALAALEAAYGAEMRGQRGMIHVTDDVLVILAADGSIRWDGTVWLTPNGNIVVADAGYTGWGPGDSEATAGVSWMYATTNVRVQVGEIQITPESASAGALTANAVQRQLNLATVFAGRLATWVWDGCGHIGVPVDVDAMYGAGSGGGGGGGDASAANQVTMIGHLADIDAALTAVGTAVVAAVNDDTATAVELSAANADRRGLLIVNDAASSGKLFIKYGTGASDASYTAYLNPGGQFEMPRPLFLGAVTGIWEADGDGVALVTEVE